MKTVLALCVLMIGLLVMPPGQVQATNHATGSCFISHVDFAPAAVLQVAVIDQTSFAVYNSTNATLMVAKKGGGSIENSLITSPLIYLNDVMNLTTTLLYPVFSSLDFRLCYTSDVNYRNQNYNVTQRNKAESYSPIRIRADSQFC